MDTASLPDFLRTMRQTAADAAVRAAAEAMAGTAQDWMQNVTLRRTTHPPGMFWKATRGAPPAYASGELVRQIRASPAAGGGGHASALLGSYARYAGIQEFGGRTWPNTSAYMHWVNSRGSWYMKRVTVPEHPYFRPTVDELILNGLLARKAADAFYGVMSRYYV